MDRKCHLGPKRRCTTYAGSVDADGCTRSMATRRCGLVKNISKRTSPRRQATPQQLAALTKARAVRATNVAARKPVRPQRGGNPTHYVVIKYFNYRKDNIFRGFDIEIIGVSSNWVVAEQLAKDSAAQDSHDVHEIKTIDEIEDGSWSAGLIGLVDGYFNASSEDGYRANIFCILELEDEVQQMED